MKLLPAILSLLTWISCSPEDGFPDKQKPPPSTTEQPETESDKPDPPKSNTMKLTIENTVFTATLASNAAARAFKTLLPLTLSMSDFNGNEKVAGLPSSLPSAATNYATISAGDIMLYGSSSLVLFYETFSTPYSYTRIGRIDNTAGLKAALGRGNVTIKFEPNGD